MADILAALQEAVFDPAIFILNDTPDDRAMAEEIRTFLARLYNAARHTWRFPFREELADPGNGPEPEYFGFDLYEQVDLPVFGFPHIIRKAIVAVAARPDVAGTDDEKFLWFLEGYLMAGWDDAYGLPRKSSPRKFFQRREPGSPSEK